MSNSQVMGVSFNYTSYFVRKRSRNIKKLKPAANEFIQNLDAAIVLALRMTGGGVGKLLKLSLRKPMNRNKLCSVCQSFVTDDHEHPVTYFKAQKIKRPGEFSNADGFTLEWTHEQSDYAGHLGPSEWLSGPLLLCDTCLKTMHWYEEHTRWKHIQLGVEKRDITKLPPIFGLYLLLEKSLRLAEFFGIQVSALSLGSNASPRSLGEIKRCIANNISVIGEIKKQMSALKIDSPQELALQKNITQYCAHVVTELSCLFAIRRDKLAGSGDALQVGDLSSCEKHGIRDNVLGGLSCIFCRPGRKKLVSQWCI